MPRPRHVGAVQGFVEFGVQPVVQLAVVVQLGELAFDQLTLTGVYMAVGLGRRDQCLEDALAVCCSTWAGGRRSMVCGSPLESVGLIGCQLP